MAQGAAGYTPAELSILREALGRLRWRSASESARASAAVAQQECPAHLEPLWEVAASAPDLWRKLRDDSLLPACSVYSLFPAAYEMVYGSDPPPALELAGRTRGQVALLRRADGGGLAIKPIQSQREPEIAALAGQLGVGPAQLPALPGFIVEEMAQGRFFTDLPAERLAPDSLEQIGCALGQALARLHSRQMCYNDAMLSDPEGRSHLVVAGDSSIKLIDFGVAVLLDNHPRLTLEEAYHLARTTLMFRLFMGMGADAQGQRGFLEAYRRQLAETPVEEILARDVRIAQEGISLAARRLGQGIEAPLRAGFAAGYGVG